MRPCSKVIDAAGCAALVLLANSTAQAMPGIDAANAARNATNSAVQSAVQTARDDAARKAQLHRQMLQKPRR